MKKKTTAGAIKLLNLYSMLHGFQYYDMTSNLPSFHERTDTGRDLVLSLSGVWIFVEESSDKARGPRCLFYATLEWILPFIAFVVTFSEVIHQMPLRRCFQTPAAWTFDPLCFSQNIMFVFFLSRFGIFPGPVSVFRWLHVTGTSLKRDSRATESVLNHSTFL